MQLDAFTSAWEGVDLKYAKSKNLTAYDVLIIASMVEKEVQVPKERPLVAAVIYNRLKARMPLGIDATIRYGLDIPPTQAILESQLHSDSPYNTREVPGLTPTPIANPGLASIQAAAHPGEGRLPLLHPQAGLQEPLLHGQPGGVRQLQPRGAELLTGETRLVGLLGNPVSHSLSPRMQNAAFAARGLDWAYVPSAGRSPKTSRPPSRASRLSASPVQT